MTNPEPERLEDRPPPHIVERVEAFLADPSRGVRRERPQRKTEPEPPVEVAEIEEPESNEAEPWPGWRWLVAGLGLVAVGLLWRWLRKR